jgi:hypothetical protein
MVNHVLLHFAWDHGPEYIHESQAGGVESSPFRHLKKALDEGRVLRLVERRMDLDQDQRREVYRRACDLHATGYDWKALALYAVWARLRGKGKRDLFQHDDPDRLTCNQYVAACLGGIVDGVPEAGDHPEHIRLTPETFFQEIFGLASPQYLIGRQDRIHIIHDEHPHVP